MIRTILQHPDEALRQVSAEIHDLAEAHRIAEDLTHTFEATLNCIGLAAPQIGERYRVILVDITRRNFDRYIMVNPVITRTSADMQRVNDGCLSVERGRKRLSTKRPKRITVEWTDLQAKQNFSGLIAACIHHEVDHLNGKLFIDS